MKVINVQPLLEDGEPVYQYAYKMEAGSHQFLYDCR